MRRTLLKQSSWSAFRLMYRYQSTRFCILLTILRHSPPRTFVQSPRGCCCIRGVYSEGCFRRPSVLPSFPHPSVLPAEAGIHLLARHSCEGGNPVLDPVIRAEADLEFQDLNIVQKCFKVLSLASCLVRPVNASYQNDGISFHVLAKSVLLLTGKPLCVLNHLEDQPVHILEDVQVVRERHCRFMDKGALLPPCPPEHVSLMRGGALPHSEIVK